MPVKETDPASIGSLEWTHGPFWSRLTSLALPHQIRSISKTRLLEWIGVLDAEDAQHALESGILDHLGIEFDEDD